MNKVNEDKDPSSGSAESPRPAPVRDPFFENVERLSPTPEFSVNDCIESLLRQLSDCVGARDRWERRARAFQEGYREKAFEVTALEIQILDLKAHGVDKVTARINDSLKTKMLAACIERNELRAERDELQKKLAALTTEQE